MQCLLVYILIRILILQIRIRISNRPVNPRCWRQVCAPRQATSNGDTYLVMHWLLVLMIIRILSLAARYLEKTTRLFFFVFLRPPVPVSSGLPEDDPTIDQNKRSGLKKLGWLQLLAGFTRKKASTRRVNRKIADSTRNQRVFFSRYLAANYGNTYSCACKCQAGRDGERRVVLLDELSLKGALQLLSNRPM